MNGENEEIRAMFTTRLRPIKIAQERPISAQDENCQQMALTINQISFHFNSKNNRKSFIYIPIHSKINISE